MNPGRERVNVDSPNKADDSFAHTISERTRISVVKSHHLKAKLVVELNTKLQFQS